MRLSHGFFLIGLVASASLADAAEIEIRAANLPPMMTEAGEGREAEIIRATLAQCGHSVRFTVEPFTRHWKSYESGEGDAVATVPPGFGLPGTETDHYIAFQNGVSVLAQGGLPVASLADLAGKEVIAFGGASGILPGLDTAKDSFKSYREVTDQIVQSRLLFAGRADAVIGDGMLFAEYNRRLREGGQDLRFDPDQPVVFYKTFEPSPYAMVFRDPAVAADFDRCFVELSADGTIDAINKRYVERYRAVLGGAYLGY